MKTKRLILLIAVLSSQLIFSQDDKSNQVNESKSLILTDKFIFHAGIFNPTKKVNVSADGNIPNVLEEEIEFDENFGLSDFETTFTFNFMWRFAKKWTLNAEYFAISNKESAVLTEDIEWNDLTFKEGTSATGSFGISIYKIFFGRLISTGDKHEFGGGLGVHLLDVNAYLEGNALVNDDELIFSRSQVSVVAPLPNIGIWYIFAPTQKLSFEAKVDWFGLKIGDFGGSLWDISPGVNYQILNNFGISAHYKFIRVDVDVDKENWKGNFNMSFSGPSVTLFANF